jgi:hypothetical protein
MTTISRQDLAWLKKTAELSAAEQGHAVAQYREECEKRASIQERVATLLKVYGGLGLCRSLAEANLYVAQLLKDEGVL